LDCTVDCPACGERMDVELRVSDLIVTPYAEVREQHAVVLGEAVRGEAVVRLVTGGDQEAAARHGDCEDALQELVDRSLLDVTTDDDPSPLALAEAVSGPLSE